MSLARQVQDVRQFSSARQAQYFVHVAKTLAGVGRNESCFRMSFFLVGAVFCKTVVGTAPLNRMPIIHEYHLRFKGGSSDEW